MSNKIVYKGENYMLGQGLNYKSIPNLSGLLYNYVNFDLSMKKCNSL